MTDITTRTRQEDAAFAAVKAYYINNVSMLPTSDDLRHLSAIATIAVRAAAIQAEDGESKSIEQFQAETVAINKANGWYDQPVSFLEAMALLHSEVSEACEAWRAWGTDDRTRNPQPEDDGSLHLFKPEGVGSEFADILIRLLDYCERFGIDLRAETERKLAYNATRGYRHGGKRA